MIQAILIGLLGGTVEGSIILGSGKETIIGIILGIILSVGTIFIDSGHESF